MLMFLCYGLQKDEFSLFHLDTFLFRDQSSFDLILQTAPDFVKHDKGEVKDRDNQETSHYCVDPTHRVPVDRFIPVEDGVDVVFSPGIGSTQLDVGEVEEDIDDTEYHGVVGMQATPGPG